MTPSRRARPVFQLVFFASLLPAPSALAQSPAAEPPIVEESAPEEAAPTVSTEGALAERSPAVDAAGAGLAPLPAAPVTAAALDAAAPRAPEEELEREEAPPAAPPAPPQVASTVSVSARGLVVRSDDGAFQLQIRAPFMFDFRGYLDDDVPSNVLGENFRNRFAGLTFNLQAWNIVVGKFTFGLSDSAVNVVEGWGELQAAEWLRLRFGKFLYPISFERLTLPLNTTFMEHGIASGLLPIADLGVQLHGDVYQNLLSYNLALTNGAANNVAFEQDLDDDKDIVGRVIVRPFATTGIAALQSLALGVGASFGSHTGGPRATELGWLRTAGTRRYFSYRDEAAQGGQTAYASGDVLRIVPQLGYSFGPVALFAEYARVTENIGMADGAAEFTHQSAHGSVAVVVTGEDATLLGPVTPARPFDLSRTQFGAVEIAASADWVDLDGGVFPTFADPEASSSGATAFGGAVNWYATGTVRLMVNYVRTDFRAAEGAARRHPENLAAARFQFMF